MAVNEANGEPTVIALALSDLSSSHSVAMESGHVKDLQQPHADGAVMPMALGELAMGVELQEDEDAAVDITDGRRKNRRPRIVQDDLAGSKKVAEGLLDIALLSANANQLRFLITYNMESSTYYISLILVLMSLTIQVTVGIAIILAKRMRYFLGMPFLRTSEFITGGVFIVTVINVLLTALTTTNDTTAHTHIHTH